MLEFEHEYRRQAELPQQPAPAQRRNPFATTAAAFMLLLGALFGRIAALCTTVGQRCADPATIRTWIRAIEYFRGIGPNVKLPQAHWERQVLRFGSPILTSIGATFLLMWLLMLLGGALFWLASHGFGLLLLIGAVTIGTVIGARLALLGRLGGNRERLN